MTSERREVQVQYPILEASAEVYSPPIMNEA